VACRACCKEKAPLRGRGHPVGRFTRFTTLPGGRCAGWGGGEGILRAAQERHQRARRLWAVHDPGCSLIPGVGCEAYERCQQEGAADHVFGVPFFLFAGEPFSGYDRLALLEQRLAEAGLAIGDKVTAA
jgi:hypothetical protein